MRLKELKGYIPVIITKKQYDKLTDKITQLKLANSDLAKENGKRNNQIEKLEKTIMEGNQSLEDTFKEKEELLIEKDKLKKQLWSISTNRDKISKHLKEKNNKIKESEREIKKLNKSVNDFVNQLNDLNKLNQELDVINTDLEKKNEIQANKIKELTSRIEHAMIEYEEDGLPKQSKESLNKLRKRRRK